MNVQDSSPCTKLACMIHMQHVKKLMWEGFGYCRLVYVVSCIHTSESYSSTAI